jgi:hypothetical protein
MQQAVVQKVRSVHEQEPKQSLGGGLNQELLAFAVQGVRYLESSLVQ